MIVTDLSKANYLTLLIIYWELTIRNANHAWKEKKIKSECKFIGFKNNRLNYKCKECGKKCTKLINEDIKNFPIMHQFCHGHFNKFILFLRKGVYPYEYIDSWEKFDETSIPPKEAYYSN